MSGGNDYFNEADWTMLLTFFSCGALGQQQYSSVDLIGTVQKVYDIKFGAMIRKTPVDSYRIQFRYVPENGAESQVTIVKSKSANARASVVLRQSASLDPIWKQVQTLTKEFGNDPEVIAKQIEVREVSFEISDEREQSWLKELKSISVPVYLNPFLLQGSCRYEYMFDSGLRGCGLTCMPLRRNSTRRTQSS